MSADADDKPADPYAGVDWVAEGQIREAYFERRHLTRYTDIAAPADAFALAHAGHNGVKVTGTDHGGARLECATCGALVELPRNTDATGDVV